MKDNKSAPFVLVVDGDDELTQGIVRHFVDSDFAAVGASTAREANRILADHFVNLLILNMSMRGNSGIEFLERLQQNGLHIPAIFIADRHSQVDRIRALEIGDDIMQKPIVIKELVARARAVLRRAETSRDWHLTENVTLNDKPFPFCGATVYPKDLRVAFPNGTVADVGRKEVGLMAAFASTGDVILSRKDIIHRVWGLHANIRSRSLDQYVVRIRQLFRKNGCEDISFLRTIHCVGYLYTPSTDCDGGSSAHCRGDIARTQRRQQRREVVGG
ncbi:MAG: response regulator transcription factor [Puniceicoccales bacterium]|nr:response regulator transcription factor [Puniceicoccales bacterium]